MAISDAMVGQCLQAAVSVCVRRSSTFTVTSGWILLGYGKGCVSCAMDRAAARARSAGSTASSGRASPRSPAPGGGAPSRSELAWRDYAASYVPTDSIPLFLDFVRCEEACDRREAFDRNPSMLAVLLFRIFEGHARRETILRYLHEVFADDYFDRTYVPAFVGALQSDKSLTTISILMDIVAGEEIESSQRAVAILAKLLREPGAVGARDTAAFLNWGVRQMRHGKGREAKERGADALLAVLRVPTHRAAFAGPEVMGVTVLADVVRAQVAEGVSSIQLLYKSLQVLWLLSFQGTEVGSAFLKSLTLMQDLLRIIGMQGKEKNLRLALATCRNLADRTDRAAGRMVELGAPRVAEQLALRSLSDPDIVDDLEAWTAKLETSTGVLTSFRLYKEQIMAGRLEWSPNHKSDGFWQKNIGRFDEDDFAVVRELVKILLTADEDPVSQAVAAHDLGRFVTWHPRGRVIARKLQIKAKLMDLLVSPNPDVQKEALNCAARMMLRHTRI